jgi:hypothetical protein
LRAELERRGYDYFDHKAFLGELRMAKRVPIDALGFKEVLCELVPLSLDLHCSYRGEETLGGHEQFLLGAAKPDAYFLSRPQTTSVIANRFGRIFGRKAS